MKTVVVLGLLLAITGTAFAGSEQIIKQRAKDLRDQNNAQQGVPSSASARAPSAQPQPAPAAAPLVITMTPQQQAMARLQSSLAAIRPGVKVTPEMKKQLAHDLAAGAMGPNKPSPASISNLADSLTLALSEKLLSATTRSRLLQDLDAALNPGKMGAAQMRDVVADVKALFEANGIAKDQAAAIGKDLQGIAAGTQKLAGK